MDAPATISARTATLEILYRIFEAHDLEPEWFGPDGGPLGLAVQWEVAYCCVDLSDLGEDDDDEWRYLTLTATETVRASADRKAVRRLVRRVNRRLKLVRASLEGGEVVFDYTAILTGGE